MIKLPRAGPVWGRNDKGKHGKFVIWQQGTKKLESFFNRLNGLHRNMRFTIELYRDSHLPLLDIDIKTTIS